MNLIGKDDIIKKLSSMKKSGRMPHSIIFSGEEGAGRKTVARYFAALLICENPTEGDIIAPCGECRHCRRILGGTHPDFIIPERTGKTLIYTRDTMRQVVSDTAIMPNDTDRKIYFFPDFDNTAIQSQNILLKSIEEPPGGVQFIFTVTDPGVLLPTILSRSVVIEVRDIKGEFTAEINAPYFERASKLSNALLSGDEYSFSAVLHESSDTTEARARLKKTLKAFEKILRDAVILCETGKCDNPASPCEEEAKALAKKFSLRRLTAYFDIIESESKKLSYITNTPLTGAVVTANIFSS
ncbi:MAG: hypothetical protein LBM41_05875 [Ruminococcus sp.]|jgi:DNA polymerase-3 subunit delta'|nr:hypothetical protein [Ruminococcus sp.]